MIKDSVSLRLNKKQRLQIFEQALEDKAPLTYLDLKVGGKVACFLEKRDGEMMESFYRAYGEAYYQILKDTDEDKIVQALEIAQTEKFNDALTAGTNFRDSENYEIF
jgi:hypothetical protein